MQTNVERPSELLPSIYAQHRSFVRRRLVSYGVRPVDVDDACHDVFVVVLRKLRSSAPVHAAAWLDEVARRVAAGRRRRASAQREVLTEDPMEATASSSSLDPVLRNEGDMLLHAAIDRLDPRDRDLLALDVAAELSLTDIARLTRCDPKTARARLGSAKRRVARWMRDLERPGASPALGRSFVPECAPRRPSNGPSLATRAGHLEVLENAPRIAAAALDNVVLAVWRSRVGHAELDVVEACARRLRATREDRLAYLAVVEPGWEPPDAATRQRMVSILRCFREDTVAHGTVLEPRVSPLAGPMISAITFLVGGGDPPGLFSEVEACARWMRDRARARGARFPEVPFLVDAVGRLRRR